MIDDAHRISYLMSLPGLGRDKLHIILDYDITEYLRSPCHISTYSLSPPARGTYYETGDPARLPAKLAAWSMGTKEWK
jgi:hypothetical protein